jgi:nitrilase
MANSVRVAACHAAPTFLSARKTTQKAVSLIERASLNQANLVIFPETYIPAFPLWSALRAPTQIHALFQKMVAESVYADGEEVRTIREAARKAQTYVSIGISEKVHYSVGCIFNSNLIIGPNGAVLNHHRKLVPTFFEKLTWAPGDGHGLRVIETPFGKIGALICGENTNPLARYALMAQGEQLHISTWPAVWPTRVAALGSKGTHEGKNYDNVTANRTRAAAHCFEAKAFGVLCSGFLDELAIDTIAFGAPDAESIKKVLRDAQRGATMFLGPTGAPITGFVVHEVTGERKETEILQEREGILYADLDVSECVEGKQFHDVVGGYQRHDVFELKVNHERQKPIQFRNST